MKKQLLLAAISVAVMAAPYAEAGSGFSRSSSPKSSSGSSSSGFGRSLSSSSSSGSPSRNYGSSSSFSSTSRNPAPPSYTPQYRATPVAAAPAPAAAPKSSGFSSAATSTTSRKVAAVAGGTALGGALYAAQANHDAVAAYDRSQRPAPAPAPSPSVASASPNYPPRPTTVSTSGYQVPQQTHVVVVHEEPHHHYYSQPDPTTAYVAGMLAGERHARNQDRDRGYYGSPVQATAPSVATTTTSPAAAPNAQPTAPAVVANATPAEQESHTGLVIFLVVLALSAGGLYAYYALRIKRGPKAPNYTL